MLSVTIPAPAKLNLHLRVGGRRPDGFHAIESLFLALAFGDTLHFETTREPESLEIHMDWRGILSAKDAVPSLPPEKNIVHRAVTLFRSRAAYAEGLKVTVEKHIPLGGGLGGGSSNAAAALLALNHLASSGGQEPLSEAVLAEMGAVLGSDVPFFMKKASAAWVSGRGEQVKPIPVPDSLKGLYVVLVHPGFSSNTAAAFRLLDEYRQTEYVLEDNVETLLQNFAGLPRNWRFENDFLPVFSAYAGENPFMECDLSIYERIIVLLREFGAEFAGLSGSGSTCFGVFSDQFKAEFAKNMILKQWYFVMRILLLA